jgi:hypothetical protein
MSIRYKVALTQPKNVDVSLTIVMTMAEWEQLYSRLGAEVVGHPPEGYSMNRLKAAVVDAINKARKEFGGAVEDAEEQA